MLLVPVLSLVLSLGLQGGDAVLTTRACSPAGRAAVAELGLPYVVDDGDPFTYMLSSPSSCSALVGSRDPEAVVLDNYRKAEKAGWKYTGTQSRPCRNPTLPRYGFRTTRARRLEP